MAAAAALAALSVLYLWPVLLGGRVLLPASYLAHFAPWAGAPASPYPWNALIWDAMAQYYPWRLFAHRSLAAGVIPLWNPHQFCGAPFLANVQSAIFYPGNLLFWLLDPAVAFGWSAAVHIFLAGLFMFLFVRRLGAGWLGSVFSAISFMFCGLFATWLELATVVCTASWLPLVLLLTHEHFERGGWAWAVAGGEAMGVVILAGHPQVAFYVMFAVLCYGGWQGLRRPGPLARRVAATGLWVAALAGLALSLSAVQTLPTVEFVRHSHRAALPRLAGLRAYVQFAMPWQHLVTLMLPDFLGNPSAGTYASVGNYAEYVAYAGVLPLMMAPFALRPERRRGAIFFFAVALFSLLVALGTPLNAVPFFLVPGFRGTGGPARMLFLYMASVSVLGGLGVDALLNRRDRVPMRGLAAWALGWSTAAAILAVASWLGHPALMRLSGGQFAAYLFGNSAVLICTVGIVLLAWLLARRKVIGSQVLGAVLLLLLVFDLFSFGRDYSPTAQRSDVYPGSEEIAYLESRAHDARILALYETWPLNEFPQAVMPPNSAMVYGLNDVQGYDSIYLARYKSVLAEVVGRDPSPPANGNMLLADSFSPALLDALGVRYVLSLSPIEGMRVVKAGNMIIHERENWLGPAYIVEDSIPASPAVPPGEALRRFWLSGPRVTSKAAVERPSPNRALIRAASPRRGYLVFSENAYPGWQARVDGRPAPIGLAQGTFRAVPFPPGRHEVEFIYLPASYRLGLFVSLLALAFLSGFLCRARPR